MRQILLRHTAPNKLLVGDEVDHELPLVDGDRRCAKLIREQWAGKAGIEWWNASGGGVQRVGGVVRRVLVNGAVNLDHESRILVDVDLLQSSRLQLLLDGPDHIGCQHRVSDRAMRSPGERFEL